MKNEFGGQHQQQNSLINFAKSSKENVLYNNLTQLLLKKLPSKLQIVRRGMYDGFQDYIG